MISTFSRAGLFILLLIYSKDLFYSFRLKRSFLLLIIGSFLGVYFMLNFIDFNRLDSSSVSKLLLLTDSIVYFSKQNFLQILFGNGYYSNINIVQNIDAGAGSWASGHSIIYYTLIDFGLIGSFLFLLLILSGLIHRVSKELVFSYFLIGLSLFRFDLLFLYLALCLTEAGSQFSFKSD